MGTQYGSSAGVWGDAGNSARNAMVATADNGVSLLAVNNSFNETVGAFGMSTASGGGGNPYIFGVLGEVQSPNGYGMVGISGPASGTFLDMRGGLAVGMSGDTSTLGGAGVFGTADSGYAVFGENQGPYVTGLFFNESTSLSYALEGGTPRQSLPDRHQRKPYLHGEPLGRGAGAGQQDGSPLRRSVAGQLV